MHACSRKGHAFSWISIVTIVRDKPDTARTVSCISEGGTHVIRLAGGRIRGNTAIAATIRKPG